MMASRSPQKKGRRSGPSSQATSPLSDSVISREREKTQLIGLNDRLAAYIDRVRQLEQENSQLQIRITTAEESSEKEYVYLKDLYQKELDDVRKLLDETAGEKARALVEAGNHQAELDDLKTRLAKVQKELNSAQRKIPGLEQALKDRDAKLRPLTNENNEMKKKLDKLEGERDDLRSQLDKEKLKNVDLENKFQSLKEELDFKEKLYVEEVQQINKRSTSFSIPITTTSDDFNNTLLDSLQELRDQHEKQKSSHPKGSPFPMSDPLIERIKDLEIEIDVLRIKHREDNGKYDQKVKDLEEKVAEQMQEYQDLLDLKLSLDDEITTYRKLLDEFANKLDAGSPASQKKTKPQQETGKPARKRPRVDSEESMDSKNSVNRCGFM